MTAPKPKRAAHQSWDDFTRETFGNRTEEIYGVTVPVPADMPFGFSERAEALRDLDESSRLEEFADLVDILFGDGVFEQWAAGGMGQLQLMTVLTWGMAQASGREMTFSEAYEVVTSDDPGKAMAQPNRAARRAASKPRSASTGGRSKRTSSGSTGSGRATSSA
ncbi:hypothetical protein ACWF94_19310 [Streptomyces sp. NPDC055078]